LILLCHASLSLPFIAPFTGACHRPLPESSRSRFPPPRPSARIPAPASRHPTWGPSP